MRRIIISFIFLMDRCESQRSMRMSSLRSSIKVLPSLNSRREALESKLEKRRVRRQSMAMNSKDTVLVETEFSDDDSSVKKFNKFLNKYEMKEALGRGANGVVRKCIHKQKQMVYAVKCMKMDKEQITFLKKNFLYIKSLNHPNIIKYKSMYLDLPKHTCYLVMDFQPMPSLERYCGNLSESEIRIIMKQLLETLEFIHSKFICHRDIKPGNILYDKETKKIKLIDFGISKRVVERSNKQNLFTMTGTLFYRAPEIVNGGGYDEKVDIWAAGITLYKLITGYTPFETEYFCSTNERITKGVIEFKVDTFEKFSHFIIDLIQKMLEKKISNRLTPKEARKHFWFYEDLKSSYDGLLSQSDCLRNDKFQNQLLKSVGFDEMIQSTELHDSKNPKSSEMMDCFQLKKWLIDSDEEDVLIQIGSDGEQSTLT